MNQLAYLFSGTGSQYEGMGRALYEGCSGCRPVFEQASDVFGFDAKRLACEGTLAEISGTAVSHRLIFTMSLACLAAAATRLPQPAVFAGHSLGEIAALTACGVFTMEQGFTVLEWRSRYMEEASAGLEGAMCAILGLDAAAIEAACKETGGFVLPVNYNSPAQTVISGDRSAVEAAAELLKGRGAKAMMLNVTVPFHTETLLPAADRLRESLSTLRYNQAPAGRFFCNLTGAEKTDFSDLPDYLAAQMTSPVRFVEQLGAMNAAGISAFAELGPGKVLCGLVKKTLKGATALPTDSPEALEKAAAALAQAE